MVINLNKKEKAIKKIQDGFNELIELENPEFAIGVLESVKIAYGLVVINRVRGD